MPPPSPLLPAHRRREILFLTCSLAIVVALAVTWRQELTAQLPPWLSYRYHPSAVSERAYSSRLWNEGDHHAAIAHLRESAPGQRTVDVIAHTRQLGQYLLWSGQTQAAYRHFEHVLATVHGAAHVDHASANEAYSALIQLVGPFTRTGRTDEALVYVDFLLGHADKLFPSSVAELLLHKIQLLSHLGHISEIARIIHESSDTLLDAPSSLRAAIALNVLDAQRTSPDAFDSTPLLERVWREAPDPIEPQTASIAAHWVEQLARTGRRPQAQHAALEAVRTLIDARGRRAQLPPEVQRRLQGCETTLLSFLQTADADGLPELALEANTIIVQTAPPGSRRHTTAQNQINRLIKLMSKAPAHAP